MELYEATSCCLGDENHDYLKEGFRARTLAEEKRCLDLELNVLMSIEDVTERVNEAVGEELSAEEAFVARRGVIAGIEKADDPMIDLAELIDEEARAVRKLVEAQEEIKRQAHAQLAEARFVIQGTGTYPDATFTLRLAFGTVRGYEESGRKLPHETVFEGLYERARSQKEQAPFDLPDRWRERKPGLNVPVNFVSTVDIIGGNSGSPVVNREGEFEGII